MVNPLLVIQEVMKLWNLDSSNFHLLLEDGFKEQINSRNNHTMRKIYQATVNLTAMSPAMLPDNT